MTEPTEPGADLHSLWQWQTDPRFDQSIDDVRKRAKAFQGRIGRRNRIEFSACAFVVLIFAGYAVYFPSPLIKLGSVLICVAAVFVAFTLFRNGRAAPADLSGDCRSFHAAALRQQYDLLRTVWLWYLLPFVPGLVLFQAGAALRAPAHHHMAGFISDLTFVAVFVFIGWINHKVARKLKLELEQLDKLEDKA